MVEVKRISVTMTLNQIESIDCLVEQGIYLSRGSFILDCIRKGLQKYGLLLNEGTEGLLLNEGTED